MRQGHDPYHVLKRLCHDRGVKGRSATCLPEVLCALLKIAGLSLGQTVRADSVRLGGVLYMADGWPVEDLAVIGPGQGRNR